MSENIIILGGGQAAIYAANEIRSIKNDFNITIISEESHLPYERPPLSKDCLLNKRNYDQCFFFDQDYLNNKNIKFIKNTKIKSVDFKNNTLISEKGISYIYDKMLIATGSVNRKLDLPNLQNINQENIIYLRNIEDSKKIKSKINTSQKVIIIGGGFIGLEIAASAIQLGKEVIVIEKVRHLMGRVIPMQISKIIQETHEAQGCKFYLGNEIKHIKNSNNQYEILLSSNEICFGDLVIIGIGSLANTELFKNNDLEIENGIITDEFSKTSINNIYAAGDVANFFHPFYGKYMRLESFKHAQNHGINAGKNIAGIRSSYDNIPWMWSDQYNLNLQLTGICNDYETFVQRGDNVNEGVVYFFLKNRQIIGACGVGVGGKIGRDVRLAGKLSYNKKKVTKEILSNKKNKLNKI